jgi:hypothetical protein
VSGGVLRVESVDCKSSGCSDVGDDDNDDDSDEDNDEDNDDV